MTRRDLITLLGGAAAAWPLAAPAQQVIADKKLPIVGWLVTGSPTSYQHSLSAFRDGLAAAGYREGQNIRIEYRWAEGKVSRLPELARDLVREQVDVILAAPETAAKRFQMIKELMPKAKRAAVLWNPTSSNAQLEWKVAKGFAETNDFIVTLYNKSSEVPARMRQTIDETKLDEVSNSSRDNRNTCCGVFSRLRSDRSARYDARDFPELSTVLDQVKQSAPDVLVNLNDPFLFAARKLVVDSLRVMRVPAVYGYREYAEDGGLMSYGTSIADTYRRAAQYVDRILKGGAPADLPVQLPTKFELVINLQTAKALGIDVPPTLLARADEVIE
jgi:putative ABC transport system substrate-binding protein